MTGWEGVWCVSVSVCVEGGCLHLQTCVYVSTISRERFWGVHMLSSGTNSGKVSFSSSWGLPLGRRKNTAK